MPSSTGQLKSGKVVSTTSFIEKDATDAPVKDIAWEASQLEAKSDVKLEEDVGYGKAAVIRMFEFSANPEAFARHTPSKQELFNHHLKGIEIMLWKDGLKVMTDIEPRLTINKKKTKYRIWVGAEPAKGHLLHERPKTLSELAHGR